MKRSISLAKAKAQYPNRYTMEHIPQWARQVRTCGGYYAPHYHTDFEWYENTVFPGEEGHVGDKDHCMSRNQTWPLGKRLDTPPPVFAGTCMWEV